MAVDTTACPIREPSVNQRLYYSPKHKSHVVKVEIGVTIGTKVPHIVWVSQAYGGRYCGDGFCCLS